MRTSLAFLLLVVAPLGAQKQKLYTYVGSVGTDHVLLAWGTTAGANTIGRSSKPHGRAHVILGGQTLDVKDRNWAIVRGLKPDTVYDWEVRLDGARIGSAKVRTWPVKADKLRFFVIGDFGTGDGHQARVASAMAKEFARLDGDNPVRFVITTGDNIYGNLGLTLRYRNTGDDDREWDRKFFRPYEPLLTRIPFYATLGNHDGNESESQGDLGVFLDNFFFPSPEPARHYRFGFGGLVDFFALDSTSNTESGSPRPAYLKGGAQHDWLKKNLAESQAPWRIPFLHHPPYCAGPRHPAARGELQHFLDEFRASGVRAVFSGHEHNFQYSAEGGETGGIRYVVSGAGGELRKGDVRSEMVRAGIEGWAAQLHFLSVEIEGGEMRITPVSDTPMTVRGRDGKVIAMPLTVRLP